MSERKWTIVYSSPSLDPEYLSAIETFNFGTEIIPHFNCHPSCAVPLTREEAEKLLKQFQREKLPRGWYFELQKRKPELNLPNPPQMQIISVPWSRADAYHFEEVSDND